jgi:hypothetical protein
LLFGYPVYYVFLRICIYHSGFFFLLLFPLSHFFFFFKLFLLFSNNNTSFHVFLYLYVCSVCRFSFCFEKDIGCVFCCLIIPEFFIERRMARGWNARSFLTLPLAKTFPCIWLVRQNRVEALYSCS